MSDRNCDKVLCVPYVHCCVQWPLCYLLSVKTDQHNTSSHHMDLAFFGCVFNVKTDKREEPSVGCTTDRLTYLLNGADSLLRSNPFRSAGGNETSRTLRSRNVPTLSYIDPVRFLPAIFLRILFNIILLSTLVFSEWSHTFMFPHQISVVISLLLHTCHMPHQSHPLY